MPASKPVSEKSPEVSEKSPNVACAPPTHPAFDIDIYDCPCGHMYGDHEYHYVERKMIIDRCTECGAAHHG